MCQVNISKLRICHCLRFVLVKKRICGTKTFVEPAVFCQLYITFESSLCSIKKNVHLLLFTWCICGTETVVGSESILSAVYKIKSYFLYQKLM